MDELTVEMTMMGGINGYGISAYTDYPNASLAFIEFATSYEQAVLRNEYLGVAPARADAAATISEADATVGILFDRLDRGLISILPLPRSASSGHLPNPSSSTCPRIPTVQNGERRRCMTPMKRFRRVWRGW